jgi:hypothetical protein
VKPDPGRVLQGIGTSLLTSVLAEVQTPYGQQTTTISAGLAFMVAEEFDRAADRLLVENAAVRAILAEARPLVPAASPDIDAVLRVSAPDHRVSSLQAENDSLRGVLIDVHAAIEATDSAAALALNERIWAELVESTTRRAFATGL